MIQKNKNKINSLVLLIILILSFYPLIAYNSYKLQTNDVDNSKDIKINDVNFSTGLIQSMSDGYTLSDNKISDNKSGSDPPIHDFGSAANAFIDLQTETSASKFKFVYNETGYDDGSHIMKNNNYNFSVSPLNSEAYDELYVDVDTYVPKYNYTVDKQHDSYITLTSKSTFAQAAIIDALQYTNSSVYIHGFNISLPLSPPSNIPVIGEIWNSTSYGTMVVPDKMLQKQTVTVTTTSTIVTFTFPSPVNINPGNTFANSTGGYVFFVLTRNDSITDSPYIYKNSHSADGVDDGPTYTNTSSITGATPSKPADWGSPTDYDFTMQYNATLEFDPSQINTVIAQPVTSSGVTVSLGGIYVEKVHHTSITNYRVKYDLSKTMGYIPLINLTYSNKLSTASLADVSYTASPKLDEVNWTITYSSPYSISNSRIYKYFLIPSNFTDITVSYGGTLLNSPTDYYIQSGTVNNTLFINTGPGNYKITANSTNLLRTANFTSYIYNSTASNWYYSDHGSMGVLYPNPKQGDLVRSVISNIPALSLEGGSVNSSLRAENGTILGNASISGYVDQYLNTYLYDFAGDFNFTTNLDPNIPVGTYSFQNFWFNGTAVGAIYIEFIVDPVTNINLISTNNIDVLEGDIITIDFEVLDRSHNSSWADSIKTISWDLEANISTLTYIGKQTNNYYKYRIILNTSINRVNVRPQNYTVNIKFNQASYYNSTDFNFHLYYRGEASLSIPDELEATTDYIFKFQLINITAGGSIADVPDISLSVNSSYSVSYVPTDANYSITVYWQPSFSYGVNYLKLTWSHSDFRAIANSSVNYIDIQFTVVDNAKPYIVTNPGNLVEYYEGTTGHTITWNASDSYPDDYWVITNKTGSPQTIIFNQWSNSESQTVSIDGLERGLYNYTIVYSDTAGNEVMHTTLVHVIDNINPVITTPSNITMSEGDIGYSLVWTASDLHPGVYNITQNENLVVVNHPWTNGNVSYSLDGIFAGNYTIKITLADDSGNYVISTAYVSIIDDLAPSVLISPDDIQLELGNSTTISWSVFDRHEKYYKIYKNGSVVVNDANWVSTDPIKYFISGLSLGVYNYTILITDEAGNFVTDTVFVTVLDTTAPIITSSPGETISYYRGEFVSLQWNATDINPDRYLILMNGTVLYNETWIDNITINLGVLEIGVYNITAIFYDMSGNYGYSMTNVIIKDPAIVETQIPLISITQTLYEGSIETMKFQWFTISNTSISSALANFSIYDSSGKWISTYLFTSGSNGIFDILLNYTSLMPGNYHWYVVLSKAYYETQIFSLPFEIIPHKIKITVDIDNNFVQGENYSISVTVVYNENSKLGLNNLIMGRNGPAQGVPLSVTIKFITTDGDSSSLIFNITSNNNGVAILLINSVTTQTISELNSITVDVANSMFSIDSQVVISGEDLPKVQIKKQSIGDVTSLVASIILDNLVLFIGIILILSTFLLLISIQRRRRKEKQRLFNSMKIQTIEEMEGLLNITAIVLKSTETGLQFYEKVYEDAVSVDLSLISGVTTAITNILSEIHEGERGFETMERSGLSITSHKLDLITIVVLSNINLPNVIKQQIEEVHYVLEEKYSEYLNDPLQLSLIPDSDIESILNTYIKLSLKDDLSIDVKMIDLVVDNKSISRKIRNDLKLLAELNESITAASVPLTLSTLYEFLNSKSLDREQIYQLISTAYAHGIINSSKLS